MDVKVIRSGRNKIQLLVEGFRYYRTKGPMGVDETCYFLCIVEGCKARAATSGPISTEEVNVKYHNRPTHPHNHPPNFADNVNAEILHEFRTAGRNEPHQPSKSLHEKLVLEKLYSEIRIIIKICETVLSISFLPVHCQGKLDRILKRKWRK